MRVARLASSIPVFVVCASFALTACSDDLEVSSPAPAEVLDRTDAVGATADGGATDAPTPEATAVTVCNLLRTFVNDTADVANDAAAGVSGNTDPVLRRDAVLSGFDELIARAEAHRRDVAALDLDTIVAGDLLVADLATGADQAVAELVDERGRFEEYPSIADDERTGRVGEFFNALEKAMSVVEPEITRLDSPAHDDLVAAFRAEPHCRFVVQL